jgi:hypothetical protein
VEWNEIGIEIEMRMGQERDGNGKIKEKTKRRQRNTMERECAMGGEMGIETVRGLK